MSMMFIRYSIPRISVRTLSVSLTSHSPAPPGRFFDGDVHLSGGALTTVLVLVDLDPAFAARAVHREWLVMDSSGDGREP